MFKDDEDVQEAMIKEEFGQYKLKLTALKG